MKGMIIVLTALFWAMVGSGGAFGQDLVGPDQLAVAETFQYALENNQSNVASNWVNPDTGLSGGTVPVRTYQTPDGVYCREFVQTIYIGGKPEQGYGTACRQQDGSWKIVADDPSVATPPVARQPVIQRTIVYVNDWPNRYYDPWGYYYPTYYPYRITFSFNYIHRDRYRSSHGRYIISPPKHKPYYDHDRKYRRDWDDDRYDRNYRGPVIYRKYDDSRGDRDRGRWDDSDRGDRRGDRGKGSDSDGKRGRK